MDVSHLLLLTTIFTITSSQKFPAHAVSSIMQEILSPRTTEQLSQMIKGAANGLNSELLMPNKRNVFVEASFPRKEVILQEAMVPRDIAMKKVATPIIMQRPNEAVIPVNGVMQMVNEFNPTRVFIKKPEFSMPKQVVVKNPEDFVNRRIISQKANEIPMLRNLVLQNENSLAARGPLPNTVVLKTSELPQAARPVARLVQQQKMVEYVQDNLPPNPFIPAASPTLPGMSSVSNALPQSRGQFLRKIPIPPPTI